MKNFLKSEVRPKPRSKKSSPGLTDHFASQVNPTEYLQSAQTKIHKIGLDAQVSTHHRVTRRNWRRHSLPDGITVLQLCEKLNISEKVITEWFKRRVENKRKIGW